VPTRTVPQHSDSGTAQRVEPPSVDFTTARTCDTRATAHTTVLRSNMVVSLGQPPARLAGLLLLPSLLLRHSEALDNGAARLPPLGTKSHSSCTHSALQVVGLSLAARSFAIRRGRRCCAAAQTAVLPPCSGWNSWCSFGPCGTDVCTEAQALETITAMETNGMKAAGYSYVTLDDW
jgi:hypothetical protein